MKEKVKLGDVCEIQSGGTPSRANPDFWNGGKIPWVKIGDINEKYLKTTHEHITQKGLENSSAKMFDKGTILYTIFATLGETCILDIQATTNQAIAGIKIIDNVVCEKTTVKVNEVAENTTSCVQNDLPGSVQEEQGGVSNDHNKYSNINTNYFINNHLSSTEDVLEQAETYNLSGVIKKNYESALEIMFNSKSISVGGENIPRKIVRKRLENISYEHIVYVDNNMPREIVNGKVETKVRSPVPYIVTALYNALRYTADELVNMEY